jgi:decaprenyl-phosphate phosphoribosyltransferase
MLIVRTLTNTIFGRHMSNRLDQSMGSFFSPPALLEAMRPQQWTKNLITFAAVLFGFRLQPEPWISSLIAFCLFSFLSSGFYLVNDLADVEADRRHPVKCKRPIAAGLVSVPVAFITAVLLLVGSLGLGLWYSKGLGLILSCYAVMQVAYNLKLKRTVILDVLTIAMGFVLRACAGGVASGVALSPWFLLCTAMLALFLGVEKRKAELRFCEKRGIPARKVLERYSLDLLTRMESVVTTSALVCYALWASGPLVKGAPTTWMMLSVPFVLYGIFRYQLLSDPEEIARRNENGSGEEQTERPEKVLINDRGILLTVLTWGSSCLAILWLNHAGILQ